MANWTDVAELRSEIVNQKGEVRDMRMDLYDVVYHTAEVPYRNIDYFGQITEPTAGLRRFMGQIASRLGADTTAAASQPALYHLDQGMGGGKSHALVGLYHMASDPEAFFRTDLGVEVLEEATETASITPDLKDAIPVVLCADRMTPDIASVEFGPATNLHERFLWSLFRGNQEHYQRHREAGIDKAAVTQALESVHAPVLILIDELTDYGQMLSTLGSISEEQAFLNSLFDAVDNLPNVVAVVVMIRSDLDDAGYTEATEQFRDYITGRLDRNGITATVADAGDFAAIIRRRLFRLAPNTDSVATESASKWIGADDSWVENVFLNLPSGRTLDGFVDRARRTFPFHPDLMDLVESDWARHTGYQRVRSTVTIFAATAYYWQQQAASGEWAPPMIGVGDIPLHTQAIEAVLSSGLLHGNDKAISNFRQVAASDIIAKDSGSGTATEIDSKLELADDILISNPGQRLATALFFYSLVPRTQTRRGATKPELLAACFGPEQMTYQDADTVFGAITDDEDGLGSLEVFEGRGGNTPTRYVISTEMTLRMHFRSARKRVTPEAYDDYLWERAKSLAKAGPAFNDVITVERPQTKQWSQEELFREIDQTRRNRLVVLDPRKWTMLNGKDSDTKDDIRMLLGVGGNAMHVLWAASTVVVSVNTQRREQARKRAREALAWSLTEQELHQADEALLEEAKAARSKAIRVLDADIERAFQHFAYLIQTPDNGLEVRWDRFEDDSFSSLKGGYVWDELVGKGRAVRAGQLSGSYLQTLMSSLGRKATLSEITDWFWSNPLFPLVPGEEDVKTAIFAAIDDEWAIVDTEGQAYGYDHASDIPLRSSDLYLVQVEGVQDDHPATGEGGETDLTPLGEEDQSTDSGTTFKRYRLRVPPRALTSDEQREKAFRLLMGLAALVDPAGDLPDIQLLEIDLHITAAEGAIDSVRDLLEEIGGTWIEADDFS